MAKEKKAKKKKVMIGTTRGKGTRYSCLYPTARKKAGTTYSPKW